MDERSIKTVVNRIIQILAKDKPTFKEACSTMYAVRKVVELQGRYVGLCPVVSDSKKVDEIFSLFIETPTTDSDTNLIIRTTLDELGELSNQSRLSVS